MILQILHADKNHDKLKRMYVDLFLMWYTVLQKLKEKKVFLFYKQS